MSVRAKFRVDTITQYMSSKTVCRSDGVPVSVPQELWTVVMSPVYGNGDPDHENTKFWQATPSGKLELGCTNAEAVKQLKLGKEYYLDLVEADKE